jgi:MFS family permease
MSWSVAALVAPLASGITIDRFGANWLWAGCAAIGTAAAIGYWVLMRGLPAAEEVAAETVTRVPAPVVEAELKA